VVITHEHGDHAGGLSRFVEKPGVPCLYIGKTRDAYIRENRNLSSTSAKACRGVEESHRRDRIQQDFRIGEIDFHPFTIPHDAADNFGFTATHSGVCVATLMDFGHITTLITERLRGCAAIVIESNHSRDMLKACEVYPWEA